MSHPKRHELLLVLASLLLVVLVGCSRPLNTTNGAARNDVPLDQYQIDLVTHSGSYWQDQLVIGRGEERLLAECMAAKGYRYTSGAHTASVPKNAEMTGVDIDYRRQYGYGMVDAALRKPSEGQSTSPSTGYQEALLGNRGSSDVIVFGNQRVSVASQGCQGESRQILAGGSIADWAIQNYRLDFMNDDLVGIVKKTDRWLATVARWSRCMHASGYAFVDLAAPEDSVARRLRDQGPTAQTAAYERKLAVADGLCRQGVRLMETNLAMRSETAQGMLADWKRQLVEVAEIRRNVVRRAEEATRPGSHPSLRRGRR